MPAIKEVVVDNLGNTTIEFSDDSTTAYNQFEKLTDIETRVENLEAAGPGGSGVSNGDKGDITVTNIGATWTIDNDVVTNAKLANMASGTMKGRVTAGDGDPEDLSAVQVRSFLNVADGATANSPDSSLLDRANHTGTQTSNTISDLAEAIDDRLNALLVAGTNITLAYNDVANTLTINAAGSSGVADGDKGDITVSGSGATWTVDAGLDAAKIANGTVSNAEFETLNGVTSNIQTQLDSKLDADLATDLVAGTDIAEADSVVYNDVSDTNTPKLGSIPTLRQRIRTKPIGTSLGTTGTVNLDFTALQATEQRINMTGDITFTTSNITAGANFDVRLVAGASSRTVTYPAGWVSFGVALPTTIAAGKVVRLTLSSGGTANADVDVAAVVSV